MCTHLPAGVEAADVDTVDLHQEKTNENAEHLYTARKIWVEEREGGVIKGKMQQAKKHRVYQVDDPPEGQTEATWLYRRRDYKELLADLSTHPKVVNPEPRPRWEYFSSRQQLDATKRGARRRITRPSSPTLFVACSPARPSR